MPTDLLTYSFQLVMQIWFFLAPLWWFWLFIFLVVLFRSSWLSYIQEWFRINEFEPVLLEILIPRQLEKTTRAMEQVLLALHGMRNEPSSIQDKYYNGEVTLWFSLEIARFLGETHFYIRTPERHRNAVEAAIYAYYPDIELRLADKDYTEYMPPSVHTLQGTGNDLFGTELKLSKKDAYPIRTFMDFESTEEELNLDPIAVLMELLAKAGEQEAIWIQILARPVTDDWKKEAEMEVDEIQAKSKTEIKTSTGVQTSYRFRTPGEEDLLKSVQRSITKPGFNTLIRYIYIAPKEIYNDGFARRGILASFNQYGSEVSNKFVHNNLAWTRGDIWHWPYFFPKMRVQARKMRIYKNYKRREMPEHEIWFSKLFSFHFFDWGFSWGLRSVLNTEELATIFHPPAQVVLTAHVIQKIGSRKVGPPVGLAIYGDKEKNLPGVD